MPRSPRLLPHALLAAAVVLAAAILVVVPVGAPAAQAATFTAGLTGIAGTSDDFGNQNGMSATQVASGATGGGLTKVSLYIGAVNAAPANHGQVAVYSDANDLPGVKLAASGLQVLAAKAWNDFPLSGPSIAASTKYWLVFNVDGANTKYKITGAGRAAWKIPTAFGTWPDQFGAPSPGADGERYAINMTWDSAIVPPTTTTETSTTPPPTTETSTPPPSTTTPPPSTTTAPPPPPGPRACPPLPAHPTPDCMGLPPGTQLTDVALNFGGDAYRVDQADTVLDGAHVPGLLIIAANNVTVRNSLIDHSILNEPAADGTAYTGLTVTDTTVGPTSGCIRSNPGVAEENYAATRVLVQHHEDGFWISPPGNVVVRDSYHRSCAEAADNHADGIQSVCFTACGNLVFDHNTIDNRFMDTTFPVNLNSENTSNFSVTGNLLGGGAYTIVTEWRAGPNWTVANNSIIDQSWTFSSASGEGTCAHQDWSGNEIVTINPDYSIASTVAPLNCID